MSDHSGFLRQIALVLGGRNADKVGREAAQQRRLGFVPRGTTEKVTLNRSKCNGTRN